MRIRLLLVEDSDDDAELIRLELERGGFELDWRRVETKADFLEALQEPLDLIISDFQMPTFDGLLAFQLYREQNIDAPFIFVSGAIGEERAVSAMRAGARDYLLKGNLARLNAAVARELGEAQSRAERRRAENAARQEQRRLAAAVQASGAGVFEHRVPLDETTHLSRRWAQILGYRDDEVPGYQMLREWFVEQLHKDDRALEQRALDDFVCGKTEQYAVEVRVAHKDGHWVEVALFANAVERDAAGSVVHVVGVMLDLTERKKLEVQFRQAQKMEAVGRLAGGVAHDFNNLLTVIFSFGAFVLQDLAEGSTAREDMEEVLSAAKRAEKLTGQLLAFSRRRPVSPKTIHINAVVAEMDRMLRRVVGEDVDFATKLAPDLWNVRIDPGSLEQVLVNLAVNARDAMPNGGKLTIETNNLVLDAPYGRERGVEEVPAGDYVVVALSDDGAGIDEPTQLKIFEPFFTTKEEGRGTGLGLSTCFGIVKQAGGFIWVYSEVGVGTTFKIYLPRVVTSAETVDRPPDLVSLRGTETVLVAEDDEQVRRLVVRALTGLGYRVIEAANGREALRLSRNNMHTLDLLLTDVVMPEMSGKELAEALARERPHLKIVYMSGYTANAIVHRGVLDPGTHMLQKPFSPQVLGRKLREVLDG